MKQSVGFADQQHDLPGAFIAMAGDGAFQSAVEFIEALNGLLADCIGLVKSFFAVCLYGTRQLVETIDLLLQCSEGCSKGSAFRLQSGDVRGELFGPDEENLRFPGLPVLDSFFQ